MRWRHYLDSGRVSLPKVGAPMPASASSVTPKIVNSSPTTHESDARPSDSSSPAPATVDVESATSTCSLCAARVTLSSQGPGGNDILTEKVLPVDDAAQQVHEYNGVENNKRIRRLEKTVETLSHGLILALTELKAGGVHAGARGRPSSSAVDGGESDFVADTVDGLSTAFAGMRTREDCTASLLLP